MATLPPLNKLRIQEAIGVKLELTSVVSDAKRKQPGKRVSPDDAVVEPFTTSDTEGKEAIQKLIGELTKPESDLAAKWRVSLKANLDAKREMYTADALKTEELISKERELQNALWKKCTGQDVLPERERPLVLATGTRTESRSYDANKLAVVDAGAWKGLVATQAATDKIVKAIDDRLERVSKDGEWAKCVTELVNALQQLLDDYPELPLVLGKVAAVARAFIRAPMILSKQFLNMMITGDAGTGKTRLAETIGPIYSRLGLYVYEAMVVASANDFIGEFVGQTEQKTADFLSKHAEKVIFLDEAYSLTLWEEKTPGNRQLAGYSPEAVAKLIAVLSESVGRFLFIVAGYEREMREDFLAANDGFDRRFPIRIALGAPSIGTLVRAFFGAIAEAIVGPAPSSASSDTGQVEWKEAKALVTRAVKYWFSHEAQCLLCDVLEAVRTANNRAGRCSEDDSDDEEHASWQERLAKARFEADYADPDTGADVPMGEEVEPETLCTLATLFKAGAGAMVNLAGTAAVLIISSDSFEALFAAEAAQRKVIDERAMRSILLQFILDRYSETADGSEAATQLDRLLERKGWMTRPTRGGGGPTWTHKKGDLSCAQGADAMGTTRVDGLLAVTGRSAREPGSTRAAGTGSGSGRGCGDASLLACIAAFVSVKATEAAPAASKKAKARA